MTTPVKNVLLFIADQWRGDTLGVLGHDCVKTPHLDALAADGVLFANHYTQALPCGPARASILTSLYMHNHRVVVNGTPLESGTSNLALELKKANIEAALFGSTDTPLDLALRGASDVFEWICPGFTPIVPFLFSDGFAGWAETLRAKGYPIPDDCRQMWDPPLGYVSPPERIEAFPPSRLRAEDTDTAYLVGHALTYLDAMNNRPWFMHVNVLKPHPPLYAPEPYDTLPHPGEVPLPKRPATREYISGQHAWLEWELTAQAERLSDYFPYLRSFHDVTEQDDRRMRGAYYGNCSEVDANFGRLVEHLKATDMYDETLIIFCSDHAEQLGDNWLYGRRGPYDGNFHVPCIIRDPRPSADETRGQIIESFTEHIDLMPTILEALSLPIPPQCEGRSLLHFLSGKTPLNWRDAVHFAYDFRDLLNGRVESTLGLTSDACHFMAVRDQRYKYVHFPTLPAKGGCGGVST